MDTAPLSPSDTLATHYALEVSRASSHDDLDTISLQAFADFQDGKLNAAALGHVQQSSLIQISRIRQARLWWLVVPVWIMLGIQVAAIIWAVALLA